MKFSEKPYKLLVETSPEQPPSLAFGRFRVLPNRRELLADGKSLNLGGRAYDVLMVLIEAHGTVVSKDALMARVWPDRVVEENALQAQISTLRAVFGPERALIRTVAGRGYQFTGEIRSLSAIGDESAGVDEAAARPRSASSPTNLPEPVSELVGRENEVREILSLVASHRLITLTGPGGIGKTRLTLAAAHRLLPGFADGVWLAEFSPLAGPGLVPAMVAAAAGLELAAGEVSARQVAQALGGRRMLLVLDTCEHVVGAGRGARRGHNAARPGRTRHCDQPRAAAGGRRADLPRFRRSPCHPRRATIPGSSVLFNCSQPARAPAEPIYPRIGQSHRLSRRSAVSSTALPLAIELAAARVSTLGITELAAHLDDRFNLLTGGRRTAPRRHQTLRAALDWSYELLPESDRIILRRLAVFAGAFSLTAAVAVVADAEIATPDVVDGVVNLVEKSLVARAAGGTMSLYRMLDTTRAYTLEKLEASGERQKIAHRHAEYCRGLFERAESEAAARPTAEWLGNYARDIDNLRAALDWAFSDEGDARLGVALAAVAIEFWLALSLLAECCDWCTKALAQLGSAAPTRDGMALQWGLGISLTITGETTPGARAAFAETLTLAETLGDLDYQFRALFGLWLFALHLCDLRECLTLARKCESLSPLIGSSAACATADWILGTSYYYRGEHQAAAVHLERARAAYPAKTRSGGPLRFGADVRVNALSYQVMALWSLGFVDRALRSREDTLEEAEATGHPVSLCLALAWPSSFLLVKAGDLSAGERCIDKLIDHSDRHSLHSFNAFGLCAKGSLMAARGDLVLAERFLRTGLERMRERAYYPYYAFFLAERAAVLASSGRIDEGLAEIDAAQLHVEESESQWCMPEVLRIKGEIIAKREPADLGAIEDHLARSLALARQQGALSWELRTVTSLAQLLRDQGRPKDAEALLRPVYDRFTEGFETTDLRTAGALLDALRGIDGR